MLISTILLYSTINSALNIISHSELSFNACKSGSANSCAKTINYLKESCRGDGAKSCGVLGYIFENGYGVKVNIKNAVSYYRKACDLRYALGCVNLGVLYTKVNRHKEANNLFQRACEAQNGEGCLNLGVSHYHGNGVGQNLRTAGIYFKEAFELLKKYCDEENANDCNNLALMYEDGLGTTQSAFRAREYRDRACELDRRLCVVKK